MIALENSASLDPPLEQTGEEKVQFVLLDELIQFYLDHMLASVKIRALS
jgi:hypothetical protein